MNYFFVFLLSMALVHPASTQVVINEVLYDPAGGDTGKERIELKNIGTESADLTGYELYPDGTGYFVFPSAALAPGALAVIHLRESGIQTDSDFFHPTPTLNMGNVSGSVALFTGSTHSAATLASFVQWGAGNQTWATTAVSAGRWSSSTDSVPAVEEGHSMEYDGSGVGPSDWFDQSEPTIGTANALPVELVNVRARVEHQTILLSWETVSGVNNFGFEIERRPGGSKGVWLRLGFVPGKGSTHTRQQYSFSDTDPLQGKTEYRIRQIDRDGSSTLSEVVHVELSSGEGSLLFECFPNPFNPVSTIRFELAKEGEVQVGIFDGTGRLVRVLFSGHAGQGRLYALPFQGADLASGMYLARIDWAGRSAVRKILLVR